MSYQTDRRWRVFAVAALFVGVIGCALPVWSLNPTQPNGGASTASMSTWGMLFAGFAFVLALGLAVRGLVGWRRMRRRSLARAGDVTSMPESIIEPDTTDVFDVSQEPLALVWRTKNLSSAFPSSSTQTIFVRLAGVLTFWLVFMCMTLLFYRLFPAFASSSQAIHWTAQTFLLALIVLVGVLVALGSIIRRVFSPVSRNHSLSNQLMIVEATSDGVRFQPVTGDVQLMRWDDMRLLEVEEQRYKRLESILVTRFYALYDRHQSVISWVEWSSKEVSVPQPEGITWDDMSALSRELVDVIYQRTGLVPRTLSKSLRRGPANALRPEAHVFAEVSDDAQS